MASRRQTWPALAASAPALDFRTLLLVAVAVLVGTLSLLPLLFLLWNSFQEVEVGRIADFRLTNLTLANYVETYGNPRSLAMLWNSLVFAVGATVVAFGFGGTIAFLVERTNTPCRNLMYGLMLVPLIMPSFIKAVAWTLLLQPRIGLVNVAARSLGVEQPPFTAYSLPAMCWVEGISLSPLTFLLLGAAFRLMDPSLEEAAATSGAGKWHVLSRVSVRLVAPAVAGVALLTFVRALESFDVPLIMGLGGQIVVFSTYIWTNTTGMESPSYGLAMASSVLLILIAGVGLLGYFRIMRQAERYATVTGKGYRPRVIDLGRWRWAASAFILFYVCVAVVLPLVVLVWASLLPVYQVPSERALASLSFQHYLNIVQDRRFVAVLQNTLVVGLVVSVGGLVLASLVSWIVIRLRPRGARLLDFLAFIPYAIPGIVVAFAYMVLLLALQSPLYGTIWALVLAYSIVFLPIATRFTHASMAQISEELEHAAAISGAGFLTVLRRITLPLMLPALVGAGLYLFLLCTKVLSVAAILFSTKATILPTYIMELYKLPGSIGRVGAISVMMVLALTLVALVIRKLERDAFVAAA